MTRDIPKKLAKSIEADFEIGEKIISVEAYNLFMTANLLGIAQQLSLEVPQSRMLVTVWVIEVAEALEKSHAL